MKHINAFRISLFGHPDDEPGVFFERFFLYHKHRTTRNESWCSTKKVVIVQQGRAKHASAYCCIFFFAYFDSNSVSEFGSVFFFF